MTRPQLIRIGVITLIALSFAYLLFRFFLFERLVLKAVERYEERYQISIEIKKIAYSGSQTFSFEEMIVVPSNGDTLLKVDKLEFDLKIFPLFINKLRFDALTTQGIDARFVKTDSSDNYSFLLQKNEVDPGQFKTSLNYAQLAKRMLDLFFEVTPEASSFFDTRLSITRTGNEIDLVAPQFEFDGKVWWGKLMAIEQSDTTVWDFSGTLNRSDETASLRLIPQFGQFQNIPYLQNHFGLSLAFDTLRVALNGSAFEDGFLALDGLAQIDSLRIRHWRISPEEVLLGKGSLDFFSKIEPRGLSVDSTTIAKINQIVVRPYFSYLSENSKIITFKCQIPDLAMEAFLESIPKGIFRSLSGMQASGNLSYRLLFSYNTAEPDSLQFESDLDIEDLKIKRYGRAHLGKINHPFEHSVYLNDRFQRNIWVGDSNVNFTPLDSISIFLRTAAMISEDGGFMSHRGFHEEAFRKSIIQNIKEKRFARGGSTITMQLAKNLFLSQDKNISRKVEEAFLVWLIENYRLVSKERLLEIYFNIIEWGPDVYGVKEAAKFYFDKSPSELNLEESIYMAMIIPRPRYFMYHFDGDRRLKPHTSHYYGLITGMMEKRGFNDVIRQDSLYTKLLVLGDALYQLEKPVQDTIPLLEIESLDLFIE